ncbi:potassium voltage-gated channel subfamily A member 1-like [Gigantopelta aegis]|uniref:potassium voltage-gated channel subfamily A member 1-like n=1 Tax=Gigantopelta aegis TaxID=1735272 RepID=UPI001B88A607|nr:potassium voltage-gated channel subfamily A member 1-like [Gigantopelta aegis]
MHFISNAPVDNRPYGHQPYLKNEDFHNYSPNISRRNSTVSGTFHLNHNHNHHHSEDIFINEFRVLTNNSADEAREPFICEQLTDWKKSSDYTHTQKDEFPVDHNCVTEQCKRIIINISGLRFETQLRTLNRLPNTLLGDPEKREKYWDPRMREFFFDRHRPTFQAILYYYQSGGRLKRPLEVPIDIFINELHFYEIGNNTIDEFRRTEGCIVEHEVVLKPSNRIQLKLFEVMEYPESSVCAKIVAVLSIIFILVSVTTFCVETLPHFTGKDCKNQTVVVNGTASVIRVPNYTEPLFITESCCMVWFVFEMIIRFAVCPSKKAFLKNIINWIDVIAIVPYFIFLAITLVTGSCSTSNKTGGLSVLRVLRVVRILKLSKHSEGLKILGKTLRTSIRELTMFLMFLGIATVIFSGAVFYAETAQETGQFSSIPDTFWWAIVSMTTVGYGDYVPTGAIGKCLGGMCVLSGVLAIALPVPVIVANFNNYYRQYTGRGYGSV